MPELLRLRPARSLIWPLAVLLGPACAAEDPTATGGDPGSSGSTGVTPPASTSSPGTTETPPGTTTVPPADSTTGLAPTGTGTTEASGDDPPGIFDLGIPDAPDPPKETPPWLVHMAAVGGERHLFHVDINTAIATDVCTVVDAATMLPYSLGSPSITFSRDDRLLFSSGSGLWEIELPSCLATHIGEFGFGSVWGISPDEGDDLYGLSSGTDVLIHIDAQTGVGTQIGSLGGSWSMLGGTWNELDQEVLGINGFTDGLYQIDQLTGLATLDLILPLDFGSVGVEFHPLTEQIYACTNDSHLYRVENDGSLTDLGDMGFTTCTNLGAPWSEGVTLPTPA